MPDLSEKRIERAYCLFFKAMLKGGVKPLAMAAYELLQWPIAIMDHISNSLCQIPNKKIGIPDWDALFDEHATRPEHYMDFYNKYLSHPKTRAYPLLINDGYLSITQQIISTFFVKGKPAGNVVIHIVDREVTDEDMEIIRLLCSSLSAEVSKLVEMERYYNRRSLLRLRSVLEGDPNSSSYHKDICTLQKEFSESYVLIVSRYSGNNNDSRILELACANLMKKYSGILSVHTEVHVVTLCSGISNPTLSSQNDNKTIHGILEILSKYTMISSITSPFYDLFKINAYYQQAELSLKLGYHNNPEKMLYSFDDFAPLHLFIPAVENYPLDTFLHPLIQNIDRYDKMNNTDYLTTLKAYILSSLNTKNAAKTLFIHHNTVLYRINRMKELFDVDFNDSSLIITLLCDFLLLKTGDILNDNLY